MKKIFSLLSVLAISILLVGVASASNGGNKGQKNKCEDFSIEMSEDSEFYLMNWDDQGAQAKKLNINFFVNEVEELHDSVSSDVTEYHIPKQPEYIGANLHFVVRTIPGGTVTGSCTGELEWTGEEYIETLTWKEIETTTPVPPSGRTVFGYDDVRNEIVLIGKDCETWTFNGTDWTLKTPEHIPNYCRGSGVAFDSAREVLVLVGGATHTASSYLSDEIWEWDGQDWTQRFFEKSPPANMFQTMVYDPVRQEIMMFGGVINRASNTSTNQTWVYNGTTWTLKSPANSPAPRHFTATAFDSVRNEVVLFGGWNGSGTYGDTWTWDGTNWTQKFPSVSTRTAAGMNMAFDQRKGVAVLFGGTYCCSSSGPFNETWTWDGTTWARMYPEVSPPARSHFGMIYSTVLNKIIGFGGIHEYDSSAVYDKTWELLIP